MSPFIYLFGVGKYCGDFFSVDDNLLFNVPCLLFPNHHFIWLFPLLLCVVSVSASNLMLTPRIYRDTGEVSRSRDPTMAQRWRRATVTFIFLWARTVTAQPNVDQMLIHTFSFHRNCFPYIIYRKKTFSLESNDTPLREQTVLTSHSFLVPRLKVCRCWSSGVTHG